MAVKEMRSMQPGDVTATYADISAIAALTGYRPKVDLAEGIGRFVEWYLNEYEESGREPVAAVA
jgi:UDP-glucuronate 4-epimerase